MSLRLHFFSALLVASWAVGSASDARTPTSPWVINSNNAKCMASRAYGGAEVPVHLILKAAATGGGVQLSVARKGSEIDADRVKGELVIDERASSSISVWAYTTGASNLSVHTMYLNAAEFALVREAKIIALRSGELDESFALSDMAATVKLMDDCVANLRREFNITDPETGEISPLKRRAKANSGELIADRDYPRAARDRNLGGTVKFGLLVDERGLVADCWIIESSGVAVLDGQVCTLLTARARFQPAIGGDGKPAKDSVTAAIVWSMD